MKVEERRFWIEDVECEIIIEVMNRQKDIFEIMDELLDYMEYDKNYTMEDDCFEIIYKDGTIDLIDEFYDGHKIKRNNILSMCNINSGTAVVYGNFAINEHGVTSASVEEEIADHNIKEIC